MKKKKISKAKEEIHEVPEAKVDSSHFKKQFIIIVFSMVVLILLVLFVYWYLQSIQTVNYEGIKFEKQKYGKMIFYYYYYTLENPAGNVIKYNLYFRNDPRSLRDIPVTGNITYPAEGDYMFVSVNNSGFEKCGDSVLAMGTLGGFLSNNYINFMLASPDMNESRTKNISYINCGGNVTKTTLLIMVGNETKITKKDKCYTMEVANCEILKAVEKWELQSLVDARKTEANKESIYSLK